MAANHLTGIDKIKYNYNTKKRKQSYNKAANITQSNKQMNQSPV